MAIEIPEPKPFGPIWVEMTPEQRAQVEKGFREVFEFYSEEISKIKPLAKRKNPFKFCEAMTQFQNTLDTSLLLRLNNEMKSRG